MSACDRCHVTRAHQPRRARVLINGDLRFDHASHRADRRGVVIRCVGCHDTIETADHTGAHPPPPTRACVDCHDDADRTPQSQRMRVCETCHATRIESFGVLAPRSHLPAAARPANHTLAFRTDHGPDAEAAPAACAACHPVMSGGRRDTCDECHQLMRPDDHVVGWAEWEHGPEAATDSDRCATCHTGGFCVACHAQPPRSHIPLAAFARGGHAETAALDLRACTVCHTTEADCSGLGCHVRGAP